MSQIQMLQNGDPLWEVIDLLLQAISDDNNLHGGLLSRETMTLADRLRVQVHRDRKREALAKRLELVDA